MKNRFLGVSIYGDATVSTVVGGDRQVSREIRGVSEPFEFLKIELREGEDPCEVALELFEGKFSRLAHHKLKKGKGFIESLSNNEYGVEEVIYEIFLFQRDFD